MSVITVTPTVDLVNVPARVRLDVADTGSPSLTSATVTRLNPDGTTVPVRTTDGNPVPISGGVGLVYDYEMPYSASVTYSSVETPANVSAPVTVPISDIWLVHPGVPALSQPIDLLPGSLMEEDYDNPVATYWPLGRSTPITIGTGARHSATSSLMLLTETPTALAGLKSLLQDGSVLFLNIPAGMGLEFDACYIRPGALKLARLTDVNANIMRSFSMPFTVVARPAGGSQSQRTLTDLFVYPSITALDAHYATLADVLAGP